MLAAVKPYFGVAKNTKINSIYKKHYISIFLGELYNRAIFKKSVK